MKRFIVSGLLALGLISVVQADPVINVLRTNKVGAGTALWTDAIAETLNNNDYETKVVGLDSCRNASQWIRANPDEPYILLAYNEQVVLDSVNPEHPAACGYDLNKTEVVAVIGKWWNFICGHKGKNDTIDALVNHGKGTRTGVWNSLVSHNVAKGQLKAIGSETNVVGFASGKDLMASFNTGELDYIILSTEHLAASLPTGSCFATNANPDTAAKYMSGRTSYSSIADIPFGEYGIWPTLLAGNVNLTALRDVFKNKTSETFNKLGANLVKEDVSPEKQKEDFDRLAEALKDVF